MAMRIPPPLITAISRLEAAGFSAWLVGGCVRDFLLDREPADWDIATNALPAQVHEELEGFSVFDTGLQHGTVTARIGGLSMEITTFRVDGPYEDHRHPDRVEFTRDLRADLSRRDFTIGAMAWHPDRGLCDYFGGQEDLRAGVIRCVGNPDARFEEDTLRILRALRFASVLGFHVEDNTARSILKNVGLLSHIAAERVAIEMTKLLCGQAATEILLGFVSVFAFVLPELAPCIGLEQRNPYHVYTVYEHTARAVGYAPPEPGLRWAALLHDIGKPLCHTRDENGRDHFHGHPAESARLAEEALRRLKFDNKTVAFVTKMAEIHDRPIAPEERGVCRTRSRLGEEAVRALVRRTEADMRAQSPAFLDRLEDLRAIEAILDGLIARGDCVSLATLAVDGRDLIRVGFPSGRGLGELLRFLLAEVIEGRCENDKQALLRLVEEFNSRYESSLP